MNAPVAAFVPDASVILKWVLDADEEAGHAAASHLLERWRQGEVDLAVPSLWIYEVGNVLCLKRPVDAAEVLVALQGLGLWEIPLVQRVLGRTVELATGHGITFYDASYLAVAEQRKAILVTADRKFARRLPDGFPVEVLA
jgi:predicted nucleic acid-binding protein